MPNTSMKRSAVLVASALGLAGAFFGGAALAADRRLDDATELIAKAISVLKAGDNLDPKLELSGHRREAVTLLTRAQSEILKARQAAEAPTPKDPKPPTQKEPKPPTSKGVAEAPRDTERDARLSAP